MISVKQHWENIYKTKAENEVSWFQPYPKTSMQFIAFFNLPFNANILDVGGGDSHFADALLDKGYKNIYVLDISGNAIEKAKQRLGEKASEIHWIITDITKFEPPVQFDFWNDRAAFHFLTKENDIDKYVSTASTSIKKDGYLVLGTFSAQGPKKCSGLNIKQYSEASISNRFKIAFDKIKCLTEDHKTPYNTIQNFLFCSFKKR